MARERPDRSALTDAELVRCILSGEADAFGEFVRRTQRQAYRLARRLTRNHEDADDVLQESYVKAYRALDRLDPKRPFAPWFYTIVTRTALSLLRSGRVRAADSLDAPGPAGEDALAERVADPRGNPATLDRWIDADRAFARLSEEHRIVLTLRVEGDLSYEEMAEALGLPAGTVMSRLARAREALLKLMDEVKRTSLS
jgi:RNA polymerase sigma-70 factor (ECF subfamily)